MTWGFWTTWMLPGIWITLQVTIFSAILGAIVAFTIGILRMSNVWIVRFLSGVYFEIFRGSSALVMMFWMFFALPVATGYQLSPMWAGTFALGLTYGAYGSEVVRGALAAVPVAQREAGIALSFTRMQRLRRIEIPQAWPEMVPPFNNLLIELLKGTALVSTISVADMAFAADLHRFATADSTMIYTVILVLYFAIAFVLTRGMRVVEKYAKSGVGQAPPPNGLFSLRRQSTEPTGPVTTGGVQ